MAYSRRVPPRRPPAAAPALATAAALAAIACAGDRDAPRAGIRFLHTFGPEETELFNTIVAERGLTVESSLVPFARGQQVIGEILRAGTSCPELIRIDATWLPAFREAGLVAPAPAALRALDWTDEALALVTAPGGAPAADAVPQTVDGLVVVRDRSQPAPASAAIADLVAAARAARTASRPHPLGVRVDGYWFVPWLRAEGGELRPDPAERAAAPGDPGPAAPSPSIEDAAAVRALARFAALFGDLAARPPPAGGEAPDELRRWRAHDVAYWITGPWQFAALGDRDRVAVSALAHAPRGGQVLVVPRCARNPEDGWRLAAALTDVPALLRFAEAFATIPTRRAALDAAPPLVRATRDALRDAAPLPRAAITPLLFDDLNPALAAVIAGDAMPEEAIDGVRRGWHRLLRRQGAR